MDEHSKVIAADIGGSHITAALVDLEHKCIVPGTQVRQTVDSHAAANNIMEVWSMCIRQAKGVSGVQRVCLAMPGPVDYEEGICLIRDQDKYPLLYGLNLKISLAEKLSIQPADVYMNNDAACFLQGEVFAGSADRFQKVLGITLGTGLGSAIFEDGLAVSADYWNMPFKESMAEDYLSTRWFVQCFATRTGRKISGVKELLRQDAGLIKALFEEFAGNLSEFLLQFLQKESAEAIAIGGNIAQAHPHYLEQVKARIGKHFPDCTLLVSALGEQAAIFGAASAWQHSHLSAG